MSAHTVCIEVLASFASWEHWLSRQKWLLGVRSTVDAVIFLGALVVFGLVALIAFDFSIFWAIVAQYKKEK